MAEKINKAYGIHVMEDIFIGKWDSTGNSLSDVIVTMEYDELADESKERTMGRAELIADAFNTIHETNRLPSQLSARVAELENVLAKTQSIQDGSNLNASPLDMLFMVNQIIQEAIAK